MENSCTRHPYKMSAPLVNKKNRLREKLSNEVFGSFITLNRGLVALNASLDLRGLNVVMYREDRYEKEFTAVGEACMAIF